MISYSIKLSGVQHVDQFYKVAAFSNCKLWFATLKRLCNSNKLKSLKVAKWKKDESRMNEGWWRMMKDDEGWMKDDEGWMKNDFLSCWGVLQVDRQTNKRTNKRIDKQTLVIVESLLRLNKTFITRMHARNWRIPLTKHMFCSFS